MKSFLWIVAAACILTAFLTGLPFQILPCFCVVFELAIVGIIALQIRSKYREENVSG